jgi:membrane fusion protein, heavy metal efflux system
MREVHEVGRSKRGLPGAALALLSLLVGTGCADHDHGPEAGHVHGDEGETESWAVTAWGERYELFPEIDPLIAGELAESHTHVTVLDGFAPLAEGRVAIVLRDAAGGEEVFAETRAKRPGIFGVGVRPAREGERELLFRIDSAAGFEEIAGGRVRVGSAAAPGGALADAEAPADEIPFLKEQQWKVPFATAWAEEGELRPGLVAPARVVPRPGGDRVLTAPAAGRLEAEPWPYPGLAVRRGAAVFRLVPRLDPDVSLAEREAAVAALAAELAPAAARADRQARLADEGVVAREEAEIAAGARDALAARLEGAERDLESARRSWAGGAAPGGALTVAAPFDGTVAMVEATPGQAVEAGAAVAHFVAAGGWWLELALPPRAAAALAPGPLELSLRPRGGEPIALASGAARLVSVAPEVDAASGRVVALVELPRELGGLAAGEAVEVELAGGEPRLGVVVPESALVDDAGVPVVYVQSSGEGFVRREVQVLVRRIDRALIEGVLAGERIVTLGGAAIRRATLAGTGVADGHVH